MSESIDRLLNLLKWPCAIVAVLLLPGSVLALIDLLAQVASAPMPILPFVGGFLVYALLWWLFFRQRVFGALFSTLEHELTHAIFALLTLHRVTGIRATWRSGGGLTIRGKGNWLITISPYFCPTLCVLLFVPLVIVPSDKIVWLNALIGAALSYHLTSTWRETHLGQSDLQEVGLLFAWMFLPIANVAAFGVVLSFSHGGLDGLYVFLDGNVQQSARLLDVCGLL